MCEREKRRRGERGREKGEREGKEKEQKERKEGREREERRCEDGGEEMREGRGREKREGWNEYNSIKSTGNNPQLQPLTARTWVSVCREERPPSLAVHRVRCETPGTKGVL